MLLSIESREILSRELAREDLQVFSVVRMAARDMADGNVASAIARLRVDADKLRMHSTELYEFISSVEPLNKCRWCNHEWLHVMGKFCPACNRFQ